LATWRVTATSACTVDHIAQLLGGHPQHDPASGHAEVVTGRYPPPWPARAQGPLARRRRACLRRCRSGRRVPCVCPSTLAQRRSMAKQGCGCQPRAEMRFRLLADPALGAFILLSDDWSFVETVIKLRAACRSARATTPPARGGSSQA
jgi:hypothetical protein